MTTRRLLSLLVGLTLAGCSASDPVDEPNGSSSECTGGKCDAFAPPALQTLDATIGECTVTPDLETEDEFFAVDQAECAFVDFDESVGAQVNSVIFETVQLETSRHSSVRYAREELDGSPKTVATWTTDGYPVRMTVQPIVYVKTTSGRISSPSSSGEYILPKVTMDVLNRPEEPTSQTLELPLEFHQVVIWPTQELADRWAAGEADFLFVKLASEVEIDGDTRHFSFSRHARSGDDLAPLAETIFSVPASESGPAFVEVTLDSDQPVGAAAISGPGYYLLGADGSLTAATPEEVEERGMFDDAEPPAVDDDPDPDVEEPPTDPVDPEEPAEDPCDGACDATEACVSGECVPLEDQRQTSCSAPANAACETDLDCAADNVCAEGFCRLRECQIQSEFCSNPSRVCEQDSDCADEHACAEGLCRRLSCQIQSEFCSNPTRVCEQSSDCAADHACVEGVCRRLSCQTQSEFCSNPTRPCTVDDDCAADHACAENVCRRLSCQMQSEFCSNPTRPCETTSDCAEGHVCEEELCKRLTCND